MAANISSVLQTPLEIHREVLQTFPSAQTRVEVDRAGAVSMTIIPRQDIPSATFVLRTVVVRHEFVSALRDLSQRIQISALTKLPVVPIDVSSVSTVVLLTEWQQFRRTMYEATGRRCIDALVNFLQHPEVPGNQNILYDLGLSPEQIEGGCTEREYACFRPIFQRMPDVLPDVQQAIVERCRQLFPNVARRLIEELIQGEKREGLGAHNEFSELRTRLRERVIGQNIATDIVAAAVLSVRENSGQNKAFIFVGPTGIGKTELAKATASIKENKFVHLKMEQYTSSYDVAKIFGSPHECAEPTFLTDLKQHAAPPTVTIDPRGRTRHLTYHVRGMVLLFDELEKSDPAVRTSLLSLIDEKRCSFAYHEKLDAYLTGENITAECLFENCLFIATSNLFAKEILLAFQHGMGAVQIVDNFKRRNAAAYGILPGAYAPELLGRFCIVPFGPIPRGECYQKVIGMKLDAYCASLQKIVHCREITIGNRLAVCAAIEGRVYGEGIDLRQIAPFLEQFTLPVCALSLGNMATKKLTIDCDERGLLLRVFTFFEYIGYVENTDVQIRL
jgi:hypothetical protein